MSKHQSCGTFVHKGEAKMGCILSDHCGKEGSFEDENYVHFKCTDGAKEINLNQPLGYTWVYEYNE